MGNVEDLSQAAKPTTKIIIFRQYFKWIGKELIRWRAALSSLTGGKSIDNEEYLSQFRTYMNMTIDTQDLFSTICTI